LPPWVDRVLASHTAGAQVRAFARALTRYRDPQQVRFVKLADGGITDNFGLSGIVIAREAAGQPYAPLSRASAVKLRHVVFIVVNSGLGPRGEWARTVQGPSGSEMIGALTDTPVAPLAGFALITDGCVVLAVPEVPVVKLLLNGTITFPAWSVAPLMLSE